MPTAGKSDTSTPSQDQLPVITYLTPFQMLKEESNSVRSAGPFERRH